jgi:hypothetical protein
MKTVKIAKGRAWVGDQPVSLLNGAVHYWRHNPNSWDAILNSIRDMGIETLDIYIDWEFHEYEHGKFDFEGVTDPRRNLKGFLELTKKRGFWMVVRPGPFIYSEWVNMGVPTDAVKYHRLHPYFTQRAGEYIQALCKVLVPFQASHDGHIIMLQSENETDPFAQCYEEQLGLGNKPGMFHEFLRNKYAGDIGKLNARWASDYATFEDARPIMDLLPVEPEYQYRYEDFIEFRGDYVTRCVSHYAKEYRKNGIDIPISHNTYNIYNVQNFEQLSKAVDLVGPDAYPPNEFPNRTSASGEELGMRHLQEVFRYFRTISETAYIAEYQCGTGHGLHYYTGILKPNHFVMQNLAAVQAGIQAWNWYMLVNRDNWMMSPINEWGRKQGEMFEVFAEMTRIYKETDIPSWKKLTNTSISMNVRYHWLKEALEEPVLKAMYQAGIEYDFYNLDNQQIAKPILFYSGPRWLPEAHQQRLLEYAQAGGHLVFFNSLPLYQDLGTRLNLLGLHRPDRTPDEPFLDHLASETEITLGDSKILTRAPFFVYDHPTPGEPIYGVRVDTNRIFDTDFEENIYLRSLVFGHRYQVGYHQTVGKGTITVLGIRPTPEAVKAVHDWLGVGVPVYSKIDPVKVSLFECDSAYYAVAINTAEYDVVAPIELGIPELQKGGYQVENLRSDPDFELDAAGLDRGQFFLRMPRKNGTILKFSK